MSAPPALCETPCETCAKEGLPLLLARYALMPADAQAPRVSGHLAPPELTQVSLGASAHYGLRLLRSGYVYVYDEARKRWDEYFVTADGFLTKLPERIRAFKVRHNIATHFRCARNGAAPLAGVITIRNPKHATRVWIGFSDVQWTDAVLSQHDDAAVRQRHMTCITVNGGKVEPQAHTAPIEQVGQWLPEFQLGAQAGQQRFGQWCPHAFNSRHAGMQAFLQAVQQARPQGGAAIVALHDPVGLAMEIAALMDARKTIFTSHERVAKPRTAASVIANLETSLKEQAKLNEIIAGEELAQDEERRMELPMGTMAAMMEPPGNPRAAALFRTHTMEGLNASAQKAWRRYTHDRTGQARFSEAASKAWLETYNQELQRFDADQISPLASAHATWMKHPRMTWHMRCNYDAADTQSGEAYTATVVALLRYTTDKQPSHDLYLSWLRQGEFAHDNLVMRALGLNQDELIEKIKQADQAPVDARAFPSDAVAAAVAAFMGAMPQSAANQLTALLAGLSGPALTYWDDFNAGKVGPKAAAALAAASGKQYVRLPVVGTKGQFIQAYVEQLYRLDPTLRTTPNQLQKAVAGQVKLLQIEGVPTQARSKLGWYVVLDRQVVSGATTRNLSGQALANELAKAIQTPQDLRKIDLTRAAAFRDGVNIGSTALGGILMVWNYTKLLQDAQNGMSHQRQEARTKLHAGSIALAGYVAEQLGVGLEKLGEQRLRNMMGRAAAYVPRALQWFGRFAGFGVGVFLGAWDVWKGQLASKQGDHGMATAYRLSGGAAIGVSVLMLMVGSLGPIGWFVLAVAVLVWIGATWFVESNQDNKLQEWLRRCHFGAADEQDRYPDSATHIDEYKLALAG
jgi:hypothetical protein